MYNYFLLGYIVWKYSHLLEYTYSVICYGNTIRHYIFDKKKQKKEKKQEWILIEPKKLEKSFNLPVIIEEIEIPDINTFQKQQ